MDELLAQFLLEAPELLQTAADAVLALERDGTDRAAIDAAFRAFHTLKGSAALFDMAPLGEALHAAEDRLGDARAGRAALAAGVPDLLLACADRTEAWLGALGSDGAPPPGAEAACRTLTARLRAAGPTAQTGGDPSPERAEAAPRGAWADAFLRTHAALLAGPGPRLLVRYAPDAHAYFRGEDPLALIARTPGLLALDLQPREPWPEPALYDPFQCNLVLTALAETTREAAHAALRLAGGQVELVDARPAAEAYPGRPEAPGPAGGDPSARRLRVDPARVDALLAVAEEIATATAALGRSADRGAGRDGGRRRDLDSLVGELHAAVLQVRLAPLSRTFERLPRLVRELGAQLGKPVRLEIEGEGLEADRGVVDALFEPLLHLLRNALDHGIEDPARRAAAGKPAEGRVSVRARRDGPELRLEVADDGGGVDLAAVRRAAAAQGAVADVEAPGGEDALELLFAAGVSTAARVSEVSGRGVGMDAVKRAVQALGGRIALASRPGQGTTATLWLPVSAALTRLLSVRIGTESYGVPLTAVVGVARADGGDAVSWRGRAIPVQGLPERFGRAQPQGSSTRLLIVERGDGEAAAIAVDAVAGQAQTVLRPLTGLLAGSGGLLGSVLTPEGAVQFVLDLPGLLA